MCAVINIGVIYEHIFRILLWEMGKAKQILLGLNAVSLILGAILLGLSASAVQTSKFNPAATYGLLVFSFFVFGTGFLGYFGAKKESRLLLFFYLVIVSMVTILLIIFCAIAFKAATDPAALEATWNKMSYSDKREYASHFGIELPPNEADATAKMAEARSRVQDAAKGHLKAIGGAAVATGAVLFASLVSAYSVRSSIPQKIR